MRIIGYTYEADYHCTDCTEKRFGKDDLDNENNPINTCARNSRLTSHHYQFQSSTYIINQLKNDVDDLHDNMEKTHYSDLYSSLESLINSASR